jgi:hypothetical protein
MCHRFHLIKVNGSGWWRSQGGSRPGAGSEATEETRPEGKEGVHWSKKVKIIIKKKRRKQSKTEKEIGHIDEELRKTWNGFNVIVMCLFFYFFLNCAYIM